nr:MAG TPA: hypothetical protein [Caudoviricetes sp.]
MLPSHIEVEYRIFIFCMSATHLLKKIFQSFIRAVLGFFYQTLVNFFIQFV